jgi:hypothetical protein
LPNLSSAELDLINYAALPLDRRQRDAFAAAVLAALDGCSEVGEGTVHRVIRSLQRGYWDPPTTCIGRTGHFVGRSKLRSGPAEL